MLFDDTICVFERGQVEVELASERLAGATYWTPRADGPHEIALSVEPRRFFDHYFTTLNP